MAAAPESLTEQQRQPLASSKNSVASDSGASGDETDIARPIVSDELAIWLYRRKLKITLNVGGVTKFVHDNRNFQGVLVSAQNEVGGCVLLR